MIDALLAAGIVISMGAAWSIRAAFLKRELRTMRKISDERSEMIEDLEGLLARSTARAREAEDKLRRIKELLP